MKKFLLFTLLYLTSFNLFSQTLDQKIGQMIMLGFPGTANISDTIYEDLNSRNLGGVILFGGNVQNRLQLKNLTNLIKSAASTPPFISIDQEGGKVARLNRNNGFDTSYSAFFLGTTLNREDSSRNQAKRMASWLSQSGINLDLAPVVDVNVNPNSIIGKTGRSFSNIPNEVTKHAKWFIDEFNKQNVLTALKHFPGHGSAAGDTHTDFTDVTKTWSNSELIPYSSLIDSNYDGMVMIAHIFNSKLDSVYPASLSENIVSGILKNQLNFKGLIITDAMFMGAISNNYTFDESVERAVVAGNDILLFTIDVKDSLSVAKRVIETIKRKVNEGKISIDRIDESYAKIMAAKLKYNIIADISDDNLTSFNFNLKQNYPNPFNSSTVIEFQIPSESHASLSIYNVLGEKVAVLLNEVLSSGNHKFNWNANNLPSGIYLYELKVNNKISSKKMILIK